jgi:hypothetical protein
VRAAETATRDGACAGDEFRSASLVGASVREKHLCVFPPVARTAAPEHRPPLVLDREGHARALKLANDASGGNPCITFNPDKRLRHARGRKRLPQVLGHPLRGDLP